MKKIKKIFIKFIKDERGFSYIETLICVAVILLLTVIVGVSSIKLMGRSQITKCYKEIETFKMALDEYYAECSVYPTQAQGLNALWEKPVLYPVPSKWNGPYIDTEVPLDPWGNEYYYKVPGTNNLPYEIYSYGSDGEKGGEGTAGDIYSWKRR